MAVLGLILLGASVSYGQNIAPLTQRVNRDNSGDSQSFLAKLGVDTNTDLNRALPTTTLSTTKSPTEVGTLNAATLAAPPNVVLVNSVTSDGATAPGTDLVYTVAFTNNGGQAAQAFTVVDPIPANTDFKLGSQNTVLGNTGMTVAVEYSADAAATWTYVPVSGGGGATADYDRMVTHVRWTFAGGLSHSSPNNSGSVGLTAKIR